MKEKEVKENEKEVKKEVEKIKINFKEVWEEVWINGSIIAISWYFMHLLGY